MSDAIAPTDGGQGTAVSTGATLNVAPVAPTDTGSTSAAVTAAPPAAAPVAAPSWLQGADELTIGYVQNKGWDDPAKVVDSYRNLEKLMGADKAGNAIVVPKADADPKEWAAVYDRLGRPTGPDGYKVELQQGGNQEFMTQATAKFHELGLTKSQGEALAAWYNEQTGGQIQSMQAAKAAQFQQDDTAIKQEWGQAYNQNLAQAQQAARGLGLDAATVDKLSDALGHKGTLQLLQKIGSRMGEDNFVSGDKLQSFSGALTPAQAKAQIQSLMSDRDFQQKYLSGNSEAKAKMAQLHEYAYGTE